MGPVWVILIGVIVLGLLAGGKNKGRQDSAKSGGAARIAHPRLIGPDEYECSVCRGRFRKSAAVCPRCGARFARRTEDLTEWEEDVEELEAWEDDD